MVLGYCLDATYGFYFAVQPPRFKETVNNNALPMAKEHQAIFTGAVFLSSTSQGEIGPRIKAVLGFLCTCKRLALSQQG